MSLLQKNIGFNEITVTERNSLRYVYAVFKASV
jgi:hypothetical protein